jgi:hypothetical protein
VEQLGTEVTLQSAGRDFRITGDGDGWTLAIEPTTISPSYGVVQSSHRLVWKRTGLLPAMLRVSVRPVTGIDHR